uniref:Retrovirus-related Pol polyprotein from transposon TNT 1-94 n=1 Tax=Nicotiana tabacum TaxID=4097 RepID=A0A1S3X156_TOBAC
MDESYFPGKSKRKSSGVCYSHCLHVEIFYVVIDVQLQELNDHFDVVSSDLLLGMASLNPANFFANFDKGRIMTLAKCYPNEFTEGLVEDGIPAAAEGMTDAQKKNIDDQRLKDLKANNFLFQALDRSVLETILKKETAKDIWDHMKQQYQGNTRVKRAQLQGLRKEFEILHMKAGETVNEFFARTLTVANKLIANGKDKGDAGVVEKILRSMTIKFNYVVCSIEESKDTSTITIDELQRSMLVHEQRMSSPVADEQALKIAHGEQSGGRGRGHGRGRGRFDKAT